MSGDPYLVVEASATDVAVGIRQRQLSALDITAACLARIDALDPLYRVFITLLREQALRAARDADARLAAGDDVGPLHGVPVTIKDAFAMRGTPTTLGSTLLRDYSPREIDDAACIRCLQGAGAIILGKVNVGSGIEPHQGNRLIDPPRNPWCFDCTAGGSSSGSAVAVALGMGYASVGTDLGGSVRTPAALTGVVGLKPTYGRISLDGDLFCLSHALEHVGSITRTVGDAALLLSVLSGHHSRDPVDAERGVADSLADAEDGRMSPVLRVGLLQWENAPTPEPDMRACMDAAAGVLDNEGAAVEDVVLPVTDEGLWYELVYRAESAALSAQASLDPPYRTYLQSRLESMWRKVAARAAPTVEQTRETYRRLFERFDVLLLPTTPIAATPLHIRRLPWQGREKDVLDLHIAHTWIFNLTGHPAMSVPCGFSAAGLPLGIQIVARHFEENTLLSTAASLERAFGGFTAPNLTDLLS